MSPRRCSTRLKCCNLPKLHTFPIFSCGGATILSPPKEVHRETRLSPLHVFLFVFQNKILRQGRSDFPVASIRFLFNGFSMKRQECRFSAKSRKPGGRFRRRGLSRRPNRGARERRRVRRSAASARRVLRVFSGFQNRRSRKFP